MIYPFYYKRISHPLTYTRGMALRADAARSRDLILETARDAGADVPLNDLARLAGVGVGTVYRHFPTPQALREALASSALERMRHLAVEVAALPPREAFETLLRGTLDLQLADPALQPVLMSERVGDARVADLKRAVFADFAAVLARAQEAGAVRPDLSVRQVQHLVCGIEHAVRLGSRADAPQLVDVLLDGLHSH